MKNLLLILLVLGFGIESSAFSQGQIQNAPYSQELRELIDYGLLNGQHVSRSVKGYWDTNVTGGTTVGTYNLRQSNGKSGVLKLPKNANVKLAYFYVKSQALGAATTGTTWQVKCGSATLFTAADISGKAPGVYFAANQTGSAANMSDVGSSDCNVQVVVGTQGYTVSGQVDIYIDYSIHD